MNETAVTRHVEFEAAHLLEGYSGRCGSLHGHSYSLEVTVSLSEYYRTQHDFGFVMDFKKLDSILDEYIPDHCFITNTNNGLDTVDGAIANIIESNNLRIFKMDGAPSAENMVNMFAKDLQTVLQKEGFIVEEVKLWETTNSYASWRRVQ